MGKNQRRKAFAMSGSRCCCGEACLQEELVELPLAGFIPAFIFILKSIYVLTYLCEHICVMSCMWRSEDRVEESVFFFH